MPLQLARLIRRPKMGAHALEEVVFDIPIKPGVAMIIEELHACCFTCEVHILIKDMDVFEIPGCALRKMLNWMALVVTRSYSMVTECLCPMSAQGHEAGA